MPNWTKEQLLAINESGENIIVSAGAGSGKTAVLTERVINKLLNGIKINELLILTFTNLASLEMQERIRKEISKHPSLKVNLDYLESAYITTFDSYTLSLVKKYHYLLNVSPCVSIASDGVIAIIKENILDEIFNELYAENDPLFNKLIGDLTVKNDTELKKNLLNIIQKMDLISDKDLFLDTYLDTYLSKDKIDAYINEFNNLIKKELTNLENALILVSNTSYSKYYEELENALTKLINSKNYDEIIKNINITLPKRPNGSDDLTDIKNSIDASLKKLKEYLRFNNIEEIYESFDIIKDYLKVIIKILKKYYQKLFLYKNQNDLYEFTDIEIMAINLLKENKDVCEKVKNSYQEILVDEYQDTNDLQEEFVSLISHNNVYMVGDIKQSIYGFRNANPKNFKEKYQKYSYHDGGIKIDLLDNFRSRSEVINAINEIFSSIMDDNIGGANYKLEHLMRSSNKMYDLKNASQNYELEIYNYQNESDLYNNAEIEAFIIGKDIIDKINKKYEVIDKNTKSKREASYEDFCIIMDRGKNFNLYKKIFEYLGIPLSIYQDKTLTDETDIMVICNIIGLILKIENKCFDEDFKYYFMSIARSFLSSLKDPEIFKIIKDNNYQETDIYKICLDISKELDLLDNYELIEIILDKFNFYEAMLKTTNIEEVLIRVDNLLNIATDLSNIGYNINDFYEYLRQMIKGNNEIKYHNNLGSNGVKIMNIHKSKGLEFPICYFAGFSDEFNTSDIRERFIYDETYGLILPFFKEGIDNTILKDLYKDKYLKNDISERIRLLYVALTRAKEKMIIISSINNDGALKQNIVDESIRLKYNSFQSIIDSLSYNLDKYVKNIKIDDLHLSKDYLYNQNKLKSISGTSDIITYDEVNIPNELINNEHASSEVGELLTKEEVDNLSYGIKMHQIFEQTDFFSIPNNHPYQDKINNFISKLDIKPADTLYKEHEFIFDEENITYHGIIDLIIVSDNSIKIVDYKLKNIDNPKYLKQLEVYYKYLSSIYDKEIKMYLYSIIDDKIKEVVLETV